MNDSLLHSLDNTPREKNKLAVSPFLFIVMIVLGISSAFLIINISKSQAGKGGGLAIIENSLGSKTGVGTKDTKLFPDIAEGTLKRGGVNGEGTHHLVRKGGASQNVYLTSSSVDLDQYVNKKVKVWGKTYAAQTAGWLMDVGYLEVQ